VAININPGSQELEDILPALFMTAPRGLVWASSSMRNQPGFTLKLPPSRSNSRRDRAAVFNLATGMNFEALGERLGLTATVCFYYPGYDIETLGTLLAGRFKHGIGLSNTRG